MMLADLCPDCSYKTSARLLLEGRIREGLVSNQLVAPTAVETHVAALDLLVSTKLRTTKSGH